MSQTRLYGITADKTISECHAKDPNTCRYHTDHLSMTKHEADEWMESIMNHRIMYIHYIRNTASMIIVN
jgi:hypothetical protein